MTCLVGTYGLPIDEYVYVNPHYPQKMQPFTPLNSQ